MRLIELFETGLPGKINSLIGKSKRIVLKDGRRGILTIDYDGAGRINVDVTVDGSHAGGMHLHRNQYAPPDPDYDLDADVRNSWSVSSLFVNPDYRRQSIAKTMYDTLARAGMKILASGASRGGGKLLPDGESLWNTQRRMKGGRLVYPYPMIWKPKKSVKPAA